MNIFALVWKQESFTKANRGFTMKGDFSRDTFDKSKHYNSVLMQQGRVQLDADWNEQQAINSYLRETETRDIIGKCGTPENDSGFEIKCGLHRSGMPMILIGKGRYYVDGILCENENELDYIKQVGKPEIPLSNECPFGLVYLDVWNRHISFLDDPNIKERALGGPDTTTRIMTIWQVKIHHYAELPKCDMDFIKDIDPTYDINNRGMIDAQTIPIDDETPCYLPPQSNYQGIENQLYRIEIHRGGNFKKNNNSQVTFKWSQDNGSVVTAITGINKTLITVSDLGKDDVLGFKEGQWVEISDDVIELNGNLGFMTKINDIFLDEQQIELSQELPNDFIVRFDPKNPDRYHLKLRRWDGANSNGLEITGNWQYIDRGIQVTFSDGEYKTGDYWLIPTRTATGDIEWPSGPQIRKGIEHHYCPLAIIKYSEERNKYRYSLEKDCREKFPSLTDLKNEESGIHITKVCYGDNKLDLINDSEIDVKEFSGLLIVFDKNIEKIVEKYNFIGGQDSLRPPNPIFFVTLYIPFPVLLPTNNILYLDNVIGYQPLVLIANIKNNDNEIILNFNGITTGGWIQNVLPKAREYRLNRILARLTIKGNFIWAKDNPDMYLDGDTFGIKDEDRIELRPQPSGDGRQGGDFEMWFWLKLE